MLIVMMNVMLIDTVTVWIVGMLNIMLVDTNAEHEYLLLLFLTLPDELTRRSRVCCIISTTT